MHEYILFFMPGSQGRFLASVFWATIKNRNYIFNTPSNFNSWHRDDDYTITTQNLTSYTSNNFYNELTWKHISNLAFYRSHYYPDWTRLDNDKFKNTKFIIVHVDQHDLTECTANEWYKNSYSKLKGFDNSIDQINSTIYTSFQRTFGEMSYTEFISKLNTDNLQQLIIQATPRRLEWLTATRSIDPEKRIDFIFPKIPENFADRTLIIDYKDILTKSTTGYVALDKFLEFSKATASQESINNSIKYFELNLQNRNEIIDKYMYKLNIVKL